MEALRVGSFIYTMGECVKEMMSDACTEKGGYLEMYILAGKQMAYYSNCDIPINEEDRKFSSIHSTTIQWPETHPWPKKPYAPTSPASKPSAR